MAHYVTYVVPKLLIQGWYNYYIGPELRVWEQPSVSPSIPLKISTVLFDCYHSPPFVICDVLVHMNLVIGLYLIL